MAKPKIKSSNPKKLPGKNPKPPEMNKNRESAFYQKKMNKFFSAHEKLKVKKEKLMKNVKITPGPAPGSGAGPGPKLRSRSKYHKNFAKESMTLPVIECKKSDINLRFDSFESNLLNNSNWIRPSISKYNSTTTKKLYEYLDTTPPISKAKLSAHSLRPTSQKTVR